ncbi:MAG: hypothetical protein AAFO75_02010, partial [Pseudomonadota bacterium]
MSEQIFVTDTGTPRNGGETAPHSLNQAEARLVEAARTGQLCDLGGQVISGHVLAGLLDGANDRLLVGGEVFRLRNAVVIGEVQLDGATVGPRLLFEHVTFRLSPGGDTARPAWEPESTADQATVALLDVNIRRGAKTAGVTNVGVGDRVVSLDNANVPSAVFKDCRFEGDVTARSCVVEGDVVLDHSTVAGRLDLDMARLGGGLSCDGSKLGVDPEIAMSTVDGSSHQGVALQARGLETGCGVLLDNSVSHGCVVMRDAAIATGLSALGLRVVGSETSVDLTAARIGGACDFTSASCAGAMRLSRAEIREDLVLDRLSINGAGHGLQADGVNVGGHVACDGLQSAGVLDLKQSQIGRNIDIHDAVFGDGTRGIDLSSARLAADLSIAKSKAIGLINLRRASVAHAVRVTRTRIYGGRYSLLADGLRVGEDAQFSHSFFFGAVALNTAQIGRSLILSSAVMKVEQGEAFAAAAAQVARDVLFNDGFQSSGGIVLQGAVIGHRCDFSNGRFVSSALARNGAARNTDLNAILSPDSEVADQQDAAALCGIDTDTTVLGLSALRAEVLIFGGDHTDRPIRGIVDLRQARVVRFMDCQAVWALSDVERARDVHGADIDHWKLVGFTYDVLLNPTGLDPTALGTGRNGRVAGGPSGGHKRVSDQRLKWLYGQSEDDLDVGMSPQPWQQLQSVLMAAGLSHDAEDVAMAQRSFVANHPATPAYRAWVEQIWGTLAGYGYRPWRCFGWLIATCVLMAAIVAVAASTCRVSTCADQTVFVMTKAGGETAASASSAYPAFNSMLYAVDLVIPGLSLNQQDHWRP